MTPEEIEQIRNKYRKELDVESIRNKYRNQLPVESRLRTPDVGRARGLVGQVARGGAGFLAQASAGAGSLISEGIPLGITPPEVLTPAQQMEKRLQKIVPQYWVGKGLRAISLKGQKAIEKAFPTHIPKKGQFMGTWPETLVGGGTTAATLLGIGLLTAGTGIPAALTVIPIGAFAQSESMYQDAMESSGDEGKAQLARLIGLPIGAIEGLGELGVLGRIDKISGGVLSRKAGSVVPKFMAKYITRTAGRKAVSIAAGGLEEMLEELVQGSLENFTAQQLYDTSRTVTEGLGEQGGSGLIIGLISNALGIKIGKMMRQPNIPTADQQLLQEAQANVEQTQIQVADDLAKVFPDTTPEYWRERMTKPEATELEANEAIQLARGKVVDDIAKDTHDYAVDKKVEKIKGRREVASETIRNAENVAAKVKSHLKEQAIGITGQAQVVQQQDYETQVASETAKQQAMLDEGTYEPTTKTTQPAIDKLKTAAEQEPIIAELEPDIANLNQPVTTEVQVQVTQPPVESIEEVAPETPQTTQALGEDALVKRIVQLQELGDRGSTDLQKAFGDLGRMAIPQIRTADAVDVGQARFAHLQGLADIDWNEYVLRMQKEGRTKAEGIPTGVTQEVPPQPPQEVTGEVVEPTPQVNPEVVASIEKELATHPELPQLTEAERTNPEQLEKARLIALTRVYKKVGRIDEAKELAGKKYANWTKGITAPKLLTDVEKTKLMAIVQDDLKKKVDKLVPKPEVPVGLNKLEQKQVAAELKSGVDAVLAKMGRMPDGSTKAVDVPLSGDRLGSVKGNIILIDGDLKYTLTDEQMDDAITMFTGVQRPPSMEQTQIDRLEDSLKTIYAIAHNIQPGDMDAIVRGIADYRGQFDFQNLRTGLFTMLARGGQGNQRLVQLAHIIDTTNDLNKFEKKLAKKYKPSKLTQGKRIGSIPLNLTSSLTILRKYGGPDGAEFGTRILEQLQQQDLHYKRYQKRFRDDVYNVLREYHEPQTPGVRPFKKIKNVNLRIENSMRKIENYLDDMQDTEQTNVALNQAETEGMRNLIALNNDIWNETKAADVITEQEYKDLYVEYYLPKQWELDDATIEAKRNGIIAEIAKKKGMTIADAGNFWDRFIRSKRDRVNYSLEQERKMKGIDSGIRGLERRMNRYFAEAARRITEVQKYGKKDEKLNELITRMTNNNPNHGDYAEQVRKNALGLDPKDSIQMNEADDFNKARGLVGITMLGWSGLQNLTEAGLLTFRFSTIDTIKTSLKLLAHSKELTEVAEESGAIPITKAKSAFGKVYAQSIEDQFTQQLGLGGKGKFGAVQSWIYRYVYHFTPTERFGKTLSANTAISYSDRMLQRLVKNPNNSWAKQRLAELVNTIDGDETNMLIQAAGNDKNITLEKLANGADPIVSKLAIDSACLAGMRGIDEVGIGPGGVLRKPLWFTQSPKGKLASQFQTWTYQVTRMFKEELRRGGARSWAKLIGSFFPAAIAIKLVERLAHSLLFARELPEDETDWALFVVGAPFELGMANFYWQNIVRAARYPQDVDRFMHIPISRPLVPMADLFSDIIHGRLRQRTVEEGISVLTLLGRPVAGYLRKGRREKTKKKGRL